MHRKTIKTGLHRCVHALISVNNVFCMACETYSACLLSFWLDLDRDLVRGCLHRPWSGVSSILARSGTAATGQSSSSPPSAESNEGNLSPGCVSTGDLARGLWQHSWSVEEEEEQSPSSLRARAARADKPMNASTWGLLQLSPITDTSSGKAPAVLAAA